MSSSSVINKCPSKEMLKRRGLMLILAAPPGGGKTTITREILKRMPDTMLSVSATTRDKRPGEIEGEHYYFVDDNKFDEMIDNGELLEYALVYNKCMYGTPKAPVEKAMQDGRDVLFDVDWQGHLKLKGMAEKDVVSVFILPPSFEELEKRLVDRGRDNQEDVEKRLKKANDEMSHFKEFQYIVINDDLEEAVGKVQSILEAERLKRRRLTNIFEFVESLEG